MLPLLESDLYDIFVSCIQGTLHDTPVSFRADHYAVAVVCVSNGYPAAYKKGAKITGKQNLNTTIKFSHFFWDENDMDYCKNLNILVLEDYFFLEFQSI